MLEQFAVDRLDLPEGEGDPLMLPSADGQRCNNHTMIGDAAHRHKPSIKTLTQRSGKNRIINILY